jgi:iron complex outermembrane receptor protein
MKPTLQNINSGVWGMSRHLASLIAVIFVAATAQAQDNTTTVGPGVAAETPAADPQTTPPVDAKVLKKIVVTGSYIRRNVDEGAPSPVTQVDAGANSAQASSQSVGGILRDNAVITSAGTNVEFHGQSSANNLILLNGLRIPKPGGSDSSNMDFIPSTAVERVEILKDGASALYGSEALAGVVNIITKKEYDGSNVGMRYQRGQMVNAPESVLSGTYGKDFGKGNLLVTVQARNVQPIDYNETIYGMRDVQKLGSDVSSPGNLKKNPGPYHAALDCPAGNIGNGGSCRYNYYENGLQLTSEQEYYNGLISTGWDLGSKLRLESAIIYNRRESEDLNTPLIARFENEIGGNQFALTDTQIATAGFGPFVGGGAITAGNYNVLYSPDEELGRRRTQNKSDAGAAQFTIGQEFENFDWNFAAGYALSDSKSTIVNGNADKTVMYQKLLTGANPGGWNPFAPTGTKAGMLDDARIQTWNTNFGDVTNGRVIGSGRVLDFGDKSVFAAVGLEEQYQTYRFRADPYSLTNKALTGASSNQDGDRDVFSSFIELTQHPIHKLQVQLAARFDKYSDFGSTTNPKIGLAYQVTDQFTVRSSYGTGFKAPDLRSLYQGKLSSPQRFRDEVICKQNGNGDPNCNNLYTVTSIGNQNLDPETGTHFNFGFQLRPKDKWTVSLDHWRAKGEQALLPVSASTLTDAESKYGAAILSTLGATINRDPTTHVIQSVFVPVKANSGTYDVNGIDLEVKYKNQFNPFNLGSVAFNFRFDHTHILHNGSAPYWFAEYKNQYNLGWKNVTSFSLSKGNHLASWRLRTYSGGDYDGSPVAGIGLGSNPTYTENDLHYEYYGAWNGVITAGIRNIFNELPINNYSRGIPGVELPAGETILGRTVYLGYSQDF